VATRGRPEGPAVVADSRVEDGRGMELSLPIL
jgi:hypothetical protein